MITCDFHNHTSFSADCKASPESMVEQAISLITSNVAKALKLYPRKGALMPGSDADLVLLNEDYTIHQVFALGKTRNRNFYEYD